MHSKIIALGKEINRGISSIGEKLDHVRDDIKRDIGDLRERVAVLETRDEMGMNGTNKS